MSGHPKLSRRHFLRNTTVAAVGATTVGNLLAACGGTSSSTSSITITHWDWFVSSTPWYDNEVKLFQAAHPDIKVRRLTQAVDKYPDLFSLAVKGNNQPDVFAIPAQPTLPDQISKGWLKPIDDLVPSSFKSRFPEGVFREGSNIFNGKLYSAPMTASGPWAQLYIDNASFKQAGLVNSDGSAQVPRTWDDIIRSAEAVKKKSNGAVHGLYLGNKEGNELNWGFHMFSLAAGAPGGAYSVDYRTGKYSYASNRIYQDVLEFFLELKKRGLTNPDAMTVGDELARINFSQKKGGLLIGGVWNQQSWNTANYIDYSLTTLVPPSGEPKAFFYITPGGTGFAIGSQTKHAKEAAAWFDWLYSKEAGKRLVQAAQELSIFPENNNSANVNGNQRFAQYVEQMKFTRLGPDPTIRNPAVGSIKIPAFTPGLNDVLTGVWTGQITNIRGALTELEDKSNAALAQGIKDAQNSGLKVSLDDYIFADWDPAKDYITKPKA